jgi:imidazole glycerol-phosphate synthase subunit HisF
MTAAEMNLWLHLRKGVNGCKFRRQHPIGIYIADFYCHKVKLIVEVDGSIHNKPDIKEADKIRQAELERWGYCVMRFTNKEVMEKPEDVLELVREKINSLIKEL